MKLYQKTNRTQLFNVNLSLTELANLYETDKGNCDPKSLSWGGQFPDHFCMNYTKTYEKYMSNKKEAPIKLFEVGIRDKRFPYASCKMWLSYFKEIDLYAMDNFWGEYIEQKADEIKVINEIGVNFIYADQGNLNDWNEIKSQCPTDFDFIVEDGSHWPNHMVITLWKAKDILKSGGYYFMEDLQNPLTSRGKYKYDNSLLTEDLLTTLKTKKFNTHFLNENQNQDINNSFELIEVILDKSGLTYLAVFRKK